ncbi:MAG: TetR/AcrR family transcriptional regulator [Lachnospiraceae bacterium]|jgi:AcrR family transcriptional regulator|nr:TetR/AcrR family transcriptional regulator [Lachnospiraceae bacterium]
MAGGFTEKERVEIRQRLLNSGYELSTEIGIKKMTIAMIAKNTEVAVGTFYNFFASKEEYVVAMIRDTEVKFEKEMALHFSKDGTIALKQFLKIFRENLKPENNFLLRLRLYDWVWLKSHISDRAYLNTANDLKKYEFMFTKIKGIRRDAEPGVVVNFIKSIYALYQNRDTLFEESLQTNVDLIFDALYRYLKEDNKK